MKPLSDIWNTSIFWKVLVNDEKIIQNIFGAWQHRSIVSFKYVAPMATKWCSLAICHRILSALPVIIPDILYITSQFFDRTNAYKACKDWSPSSGLVSNPLLKSTTLLGLLKIGRFKPRVATLLQFVQIYLLYIAFQSIYLAKYFMDNKI